MNMDIIQSAAFEMLVNVALAVLALAGAYAVYYIRLGASKLKAQTAQIEDASTRKVLDDALKDVENLATLSVSAMEQTTAKALREAVKGGKASTRSWSRWANRSLTRSRRRSRRRRSGLSRRTSAASTSI